MPAISIIIPVYMVEEYMARCARSLFGQTMEDLEFIFLDDCTPDRSMDVMREVLEEFPQRRPQVRCFRMPVNSGLAVVRTKGVELATGDYIVWVDSDDELRTDACKLLYDKALEGGFDIVACDFEKRRGSWRKLCSQRTSPERVMLDLMSGRILGSLCCTMARRSLYEGLLPPKGNMWEDLVFVAQLYLKAGSWAYVPEALYFYHFRESSTTKSPGEEASVGRWMEVQKNAFLLLDILRQHYPEGSPEIVNMKYNSRHCLKPLVHRKEYYKRWRNCFPEVDKVYLLIPGPTMQQRLWFVLIHLHLYHPWKVVSGKIRSMLGGRF